MSHSLHISLKGPDRIGLVAAVSACLFDLGGNLRDTAFALLGSGFEFSCVVELPEDVDKEAVRSALLDLEPVHGADVAVSDFRDTADQGDASPITHWIEVVGSDQPGLIARVSEVFGEYQANLVRMSSGRESAGRQGADGPRYITRFEVSIPPERAGACLAAVDNTAGQLMLTCNWGSVRR